MLWIEREGWLEESDFGDQHDEMQESFEWILSGHFKIEMCWRYCDDKEMVESIVRKKSIEKKFIEVTIKWMKAV